MDTDAGRAGEPTRTVAGLDGVTWLGVAMATAVGAWLRLAAIGGHLPQIVEPDEPTTVVRALGVLDGSFAPPLWDWPPGGAILDAAVLRLADLVGIDTLGDVGTRYLVSRVAFALVGLLVVPAAAVLAGRLSDEGRPRRVAAIASAAALAVSFLLVRFGRQVHPDPLQSLFVVLTVLAALRARTDARMRWWIVAGAMAGLAAATKFIGGLVVLPVAVAALVWPSAWRGRLLAFAAVGGGSFAAFVLGTGASALTDIRGLIDGLEFQFGYQAASRLGYEGTEPAVPWLFGEVLPGTLGWPLAVLSLGSLGWLAARGRPGDRFVVGAGMTLLAYPLVTSVRFPHYILPALPLLVVAAGTLVGRTVVDRRRAVAAGGVVVAIAVAAGLWLPVSGDLGLITAARATDTREQASAWLADAEGRQIHAEAYALANEPDIYVGSAPPGVGECRCWYVVSSYNTDRYERQPDVYESQITTYRQFLERPDVSVAVVFAPTATLDYRWNLLPQWGVGGLAFADDVVAGPTVTILKVGTD